MVKFVAKTIAVNNSDLYELDGYKPISSSSAAIVGIESKYKKGVLSVKVFEDDALKYKIAKVDVSRNKANKLFDGDGWEAKLFKGADTIKGSSEGDTLYGYKGGDDIFGRGGDDTLYGGKGKDTLYGGDGGDTINGGKGKDVLDGGEGVNTLTGGGGKDIFLFDVALMPGNNSHITDFKAGADKMHLEKDFFSGIGKKGTLSADKFFEADDYGGQKKSIVYDKDIGTLSYVKGDGDMVAFGSVATGLDLSHKDFLIV